MKSPRDVILRPVVSEKSYAGLEENRYTFLVHPDANKTEIKIAIQQIFNVRVLTVNTLNREGKRKRTRFGWGQRKSVKRAMYDANGNIYPADVIFLSLSFDHRVVDGAVGAAFANALIRHLTNPSLLLLPANLLGNR